MNKKIGVYCSSSDALDDVYVRAAVELGQEMCRHQYDLVFGGSGVGLMGLLARSVKDGGGEVTGIIPEFIKNKGIAFEEADAMIVTKDMRERKGTIENLSDAFLALPGGFGTMDEIIEVLTLKQLHLHTKPVILMNVNGFFDPLILFFERLFDHRFVKKDHRELYYVASSCADVFRYLEYYQPSAIPSKWFG
jgi:hypothetical protein